MPDIYNFNEEMTSYLNSLPIEMQKKIKSSNIKVNSTEDLQKVVENYKQKKTEMTFDQKI